VRAAGIVPPRDLAMLPIMIGSILVLQGVRGNLARWERAGTAPLGVLEFCTTDGNANERTTATEIP